LLKISPNKVVFQSFSQTIRMPVYSDVRITLTLTLWPWYSTLTYIFRRCTCTPKMKLLGQGI